MRAKTEDENLMGARLTLVKACGIVLRNTLNILGVSGSRK